MCGVRGSGGGTSCLGSLWLPGPGANGPEAHEGTYDVSKNAPLFQGPLVGRQSQDSGQPHPKGDRNRQATHTSQSHLLSKEQT